MKNILFPFVTIASVLLFSCSNNDNEPTTPTKAAISGSVILYDEGTTLLDKSNMNVKVVGTTPLIQTTTNAEGKFTLPEVPFGTYTLEYSKTGFGTFKKIGVVHGTNGQATFVSDIPSLGQLSTTTVTNVTAAVLNNQVKLSITTNPAGNTANRRYVRFFLSTNAQISNTNYTYFSAVFVAQINPFEKTITQTELLSAGFASGQQVYVRAYGDSFWDNAYDDPTISKRIFPNLNGTTVAATSFVVP